MGLFDIFTESGRIFDWLYENYFDATEVAYRVMRGGLAREISLNRKTSPFLDNKVIIGEMSSDSLTRDISNDYKRKLADLADEIRVIDLYLDEEKKKREIMTAAEKYQRAFLYFCKKEGASPSFFFKMTSHPAMPGERVFKSFSKVNQKSDFDHDDHFQNLVTVALAKYGYKPCMDSHPFTPGISFSSLGLSKPWVQPKRIGIQFPYGITKDLDFKITVEPFSENSNISSLYPHLSEFESMERKIAELVERESLWKQFEDNILSHKFACRYYRGYFKETYGTEDVSLDKYEALVNNVAPLNAFIQKQEQDYVYLRKQYPFGIREFEKRHPEIPHTEYMKHADTIAWFSQQSMIVLFPERQNDLSGKLVNAVSNLSGWSARTQSTSVSYNDYDDRRQTSTVSCAFIYRYLVCDDERSSLDMSSFGFCSDIFENTATVKNLGYKEVLNELNSILSKVLPVYFETFTRIRIVLAPDLRELLEDHASPEGLIRCLPAMEEFDFKADVMPSYEFYLHGPAASVPHVFLKLKSTHYPLSETFYWNTLPSHVLSSVITISLSVDTPELMRIEEQRKQQHRIRQLDELRSLQRGYPFGFQAWCINNFGTDDINVLHYDKVMQGKRDIILLQQGEEKRQREERIKEAERREIQNAVRIFNAYPAAFKVLFPGINVVSSLSDARTVIQAEGRVRDFDTIFCRRFDLFEHQRLVCGLPHKYFYEYYSKKKYGDDVSPEAASNRSFIWAFKDGLLHQRAVSLLVDFLKSSKIASLGGRITFACIPASDPFTNRSRYEWFSAEVCKNLGFRNAFEHIRVCSSVTPRRMGGSRMPELEIDGEFFKDSFVLLFDDVVTSGTTASNRKLLIEAAGAYCIGIISLGKTV